MFFQNSPLSSPFKEDNFALSPADPVTVFTVIAAAIARGHLCVPPIAMIAEATRARVSASSPTSAATNVCTRQGRSLKYCVFEHPAVTTRGFVFTTFVALTTSLRSATAACRSTSSSLVVRLVAIAWSRRALLSSCVVSSSRE